MKLVLHEIIDGLAFNHYGSARITGRFQYVDVNLDVLVSGKIEKPLHDRLWPILVQIEEGIKE